MKKRDFAASLVLTLVLVACTNEKSKVEGLWKHSDKPAWIRIEFSRDIGSGRIARHDDNQDAVGLSLLEQIQRDRNLPNQWNAMIYSAEDDNYVNAILSLNEGDTLLVSTNASEASVEVLRLIRENNP